MKILIADSGSTKTDWALVDEQGNVMVLGGDMRELGVLRLIQRHQKVYATLGGRMQTDEVHALSMKTYTPAEWAANAAA